jgi:hypothetical protein
MRAAKNPFPAPSLNPLGSNLTTALASPHTTQRPARRATKACDNNGRRRLVDPTSRERDFATDEQEFMQAMQDYKQRSGRMFPTWSEVLEVLQGLGYAKKA